MDDEYYKEKGRYYGYPECCIYSFYSRRNEHGNLISHTERSPAQQAAAKHGFIPCESHAQDILEGKMRIEDLILHTRECERSFSRPKQLPAKYQHCTDTPRCSPKERTPLVVEKHCLSE